MERTRLSTKGQVVLPKRIRETRAWKAGMEFSVEATAEGILLRPLEGRRVVTLEEVAGCLRRPGKAKSIEEMDAAVAAEVRGRRDRGRY